jgi:hypothetical protein
MSVFFGKIFHNRGSAGSAVVSKGVQLNHPL